MAYKTDVFFYMAFLIATVAICAYYRNGETYDVNKDISKTINYLSQQSALYKRGIMNIQNLTAEQFISLRENELNRRQMIWELYAKVNNLDLPRISSSIKRALSPFEKGIKRDDVLRACSLEEIDTVCFFIINGTVKSRPPANDNLKAIARDVAKLIYQTQDALNDTLPDMMFAYNAMGTPRVIPGKVANNSLNATIGSGKYLSMLKQLCPETVDRYSAQGTHLAVPYKTFVIHESTPVFGPTGIYGCSIDIAFPHASFAKWHVIHKRVVKKHEEIKWNEKNDKLYWRGNFTGGYLASDTVQFLPILGLLMQNSSKYDIALTHTVNGTKTPHGNDTMLYDAWKYKYIFDIDGNGPSEHFAQLLGAGSVILKHDPLYYEFYYDWLVPNLHFLPIYGDFSNLNETMKKLYERPQMREIIAHETFNFYKTKLTKEAVYAYIYNLLSSYWWIHLFEYLPQECEKCVVYKK